MIEFTLELVGDAELQAVFSAFSDDLRMAIGEKLKVLTEELRLKVVDNVSGLILQKQSGALASSITATVDVDATPMEGFVTSSPFTLKAWVHEFGGEKSYDIFAINKSTLVFEGKDGELVFRKHVFHPPATAKWYLREALEQMEGPVQDGFDEVLTAFIVEGR
jgi:hypothetical protein